VELGLGRVDVAGSRRYVQPRMCRSLTSNESAVYILAYHGAFHVMGGVYHVSVMSSVKVGAWSCVASALAVAIGLLAVPAARVVAVSGYDTSGRSAAGEDVRVVADDFTFEPAYLTVPVGTTVVWTNADREAHTITSDEGVFDGEIGPSQSYRYTFLEPGIYFYFCKPHDWMIGEITVA